MTSTPSASDLLERLVAIPSVTGSEEAVVRFVEEVMTAAGWTCESIAVAPGRRDLFAHRGDPSVVLSTHADTVPPFFVARREGDLLFARGACDAKGSLAAMIAALEKTVRDRPEERGAGLLLLVGEERGSDGAIAANAFAAGSRASERFLVGGEPTGNRFVAGSKGCLRVAIETRGVSGHSSISEGSRSAVDPLLDVLAVIRALRFDEDSAFGKTTANVGVIEAGTAPNVVAERGRAEILFRTGVPVEIVLAAVARAAAGRAEISVPYRSEPIAFRLPRGRETGAEIVSFACDLPLLPRWGVPLLVGPGSIAHAHAAEERVSLAEVEAAAALYRETVVGLLTDGEAFLA